MLVLISDLRRHGITHQWFYCRFVLSYAKDMIIHPEFIQRILEIEAVDPESMQIHASHGVENNRVGIGSQVVFFLGEEIFGSNHFFPVFLELVQLIADGLQLIDSGLSHVFQVEHQTRYAGIDCGGADCVDDILKQGFSGDILYAY